MYSCVKYLYAIVVFDSVTLPFRKHLLIFIGYYGKLMILCRLLLSDILGGAVMHLQESGEMYLETIYILSQQGGAVRSIDVGEYMGFSKPSVSRAVRLLKSGGYVFMDADGALTLTETGLAVAKKIYERHTTLSEVLMQLGVSKENAVADACKMEHDISDETFEALKRHAQIHKVK